MDQPNRLVVKCHVGKVCILLKYVYALNQTLSNGMRSLKFFLTYIGFVVKEANNCVC